jgi:SAF domain
MVLASSAVVFASIAVFAGAYSSANRQSPALIVTTTIEQGQPIVGSDLGQASVAISGGVTPIPVSDASELSGKRAAVTIPAGSLLTTSDVTGAQSIGPGDAVVGLALKAGQLPSSGLQAGDQVMIVQTAVPGSALTVQPTTGGSSDISTASAGVLVPQASVFDVEIPPVSSSSGVVESVSVEVSATFAAGVSTAAAAAEVSLVLLPNGAGIPAAGVRSQAGGQGNGAPGGSAS